MARTWGFHSVALASGASPLEVQAGDGLAEILAADAERSSWTRASSYRVVGRARLEEEVRVAALAQSAPPAEDASPEHEASLEASTGPVAIVTADVSAPNVEMTAEALALAFQRLVDQDKREFEQFEAEAASALARDGDEEEPPSSSATAPALSHGASEAPTRIYLLLDYPSSLEEIGALLRLGELGSARTHSDAASTDTLPLLPLIDGALLLVDSLKGLQSRRKSSSVSSRRMSVNPTKFDDLGILDAFVPPSALPASPFLTANPSISAFYEASSVGGLEWSDFVFTDVACTRIDAEDATSVQPKPAGELVSEVADTLERLARDKFAFKDWVQATQVFSLPSAEPQSDSAQRLLRKYHRVLRPTFPASVSVSTVVFALREAIVRAADDEENGVEDDGEEGEEEDHDASRSDPARLLLDSYHQVLPQSFRTSVSVSTVLFALREVVVRFAGDEEDEDDGNPDELRLDSGQRLLRKYEVALSPSFPAGVSVSTVVFALREVVAGDEERMKESSDDEREEGDSGPAADENQEFIEFGDEAAKRIARACVCRDALRLKGDPIAADGVGIAEIERAMWQMSDLPGVGNKGRKAFPVVPMLSPVERGVLETELASFCSPSVSVPHVHLTRQLLQLEELLGPTWKGRIQTRGFGELLNTRLFPQRLAQALLRSPTVHKSYYPPTDALLLACLTATAPGRFRTTFWSAREQVRHRPAFRDWKKERAMAPEYLTPRTAEAAMACVPLSSAELEAVAEKSWVFYPEDHSIVRLLQNPRGDTWLSVYQGRNVFGLRPLRLVQESLSSSSGTRATYAMQFAASFEDESRLHVCEGRRRFPRKPDGFSTVTVTNSFPCGLSISAGSDGSIVQRYVRYSLGNSDGRHTDEAEDYRVVYGRGCVLRVFYDGAGEILTPEGAVYSVVRQPNGSFQRVQPLGKSKSFVLPTATFTVDPETNAVVERRSNGAVIATHIDGARITYHSDGTRMYSNAQGTHVVVHKHTFADVAIDLTVNLTAQRHAAGERVAVTKGGLRSRIIVTVYDGTSIDVAYNTKVTAQVSGRVTTTKPDGTVVVAKDSGRVEYVPSKQVSTAASCGGGVANSPDRLEEDSDRDVVSHTGVYYFDIRLGRFELCDREQNVFLVKTGDGSTAPRASVDLAGVVSEAEAQKYNVDDIPATATINDPIQPHVFILNGDGTALEILAPGEVAEFLGQVSATGALSSLANDQETMASQLPCDFLSSLVIMHPWASSGPAGPVFNDEALARHLSSLRRPVATVGKYLADYFAEFDSPRSRRFTTVRRLWSLQPLSAEQVGRMQSAWSAWTQWQDEREATMDRFKVDDPRDASAVAQEAAIQKRVLAAYKAARDRKKAERQKARELRLAAVNKGAQMETVPEATGEEEKDDEPADSDEDDDDLYQFGSETSDDGTCNDGGADVDDPMALQWTAFSQADDSGSGVLTVAQTRQALVHALGIGVTTAELSAALAQRFRVGCPLNVGFDLFVDLVEHFKRLEGQQDGDEGGGSKRAVDSIPRLRTPSASVPGPKQSGKPPSTFDDARPVAVGSGARAARQRQALGADGGA